jgi:hypothetical protein
MRRWPTWLIVGALCALGAFAAADGLRGGGSQRTAEPSPRPAAQTPPPELNLREPRGILYYSDSEDDCRVHGVALPRLENAPPPTFRGCSFSLSPDSTAMLPGAVSWSPRGGLYARESDGMVEVGAQGSGPSLRFPGSAPAFKPDGTLTYVRDGDVIAWTTDCPADARLFTLPGDNGTVRCTMKLARLDDPVVRVAWISSSRMAVVVQPAEEEPELLIRERDDVLLRVPGWRLGAQITNLSVSPRGTYVAVQAEGRSGLLVFNRNGWAVALPPLNEIRSLAWSPDDKWTAAATDFSVFVFRSDDANESVRRLPIRAADLDWR